MGQARNWTKEEYDYLSDKWGTVSLPTMVKTLNRSKNAIMIKAQRLGLGAFLKSGEYVTFNQFLYTLGIQGGYKYKKISWVRNRKFPLKTKKVNKCSFKVVYLEEWWKWAEKNIDFIDFSTFEENSLGKEPQWAKQKRKHDIEKNQKYIKSPWTIIEDKKLQKLLKDYKYSYAELSKMLQRTSGAIQRRCCDLKLMERPIKADNHIKWTEEEYKTLWTLIDQGYGYELIAEIIGKSSKAIRGRVYSYYGTENLDKVRIIKKQVS